MRQASPHLPIVYCALLGYLCTWLWKVRGFFFSLIALAALLVFGKLPAQEQFWTALLATSLAFSWLLLLLGIQEIESVFTFKGTALQAAEEMAQSASRELDELRRLLSAEHLEMDAKMKRMNVQLEEVQSIRVSEAKEKASWHEKYLQLSAEIANYQRKERAFQQALEDAQAALLKLKYAEKPPQSSIIPMEEEADPLHVEKQHALLREQFEEKSAVLHQTRKESFQLESQLLTLRKEQVERSLEPSSETSALIAQLQKLELEREHLEQEIAALHLLVAELFKTKKAPRKRKGQAVEQELF